MDSYKIEREADADNVAESEMVESISCSSSEHENSRNRKGIETKNKTKLRSFKLSRLPSLRSNMRPMKSQSRKCPSLLSDYAASSKQSTPVLPPDASPNYTKATNSWDARKESFQKSERILTRRSSMKFTRPSTRKSCGGTDQKKKLKKTRSIKPANFGSSRPSAREEGDQYDQPSVILSSDVDASERYSKAHFQASAHSSESSFTSRPNSDSTVRGVKGTTTLRPQRILTKTSSLKSKKSSMKKRSEVPKILESNVDRATCSSTLKDSKFPHHSELHLGGSESEGIQAMKVCTYRYCSLHGHPHGTVTPLKRFVSMRRHFMKTQKSMKPRSHSVPKAKRCRNRRKGVQISPVMFNGDSADQQTTLNCGSEYSVIEEAVKDKLKVTDSQGEENINIGDSLNFSEELLYDSLLPDPSFEQHKSTNPLIAKQKTQVAISASQETSEECHCVTTEPVEVIPEVIDTEKKAGEIDGSGAYNGDDKPILTVDHHRIKDSSLQLLKGSVQCDNQSSNFDDVMSSSHEVVPVDAKVHKEVNGDTVAHLNLEASTTTRVINEGKNADSGPAEDLLEELSPSGDSTPDCTADQSQQTQNGKPKYMGLWGLIYQHMVSGINAEVETEVHCDGKDKEQFKDKCTMTQMNDPVSCHSSTESDEDKGIRDHDVGENEFKPWQSDVIKQVQEAFDKILSEIPDQSSDDRLITSDLTSGQEASKNNQCEGEQQSIPSSVICTKENMVQDQEDAQLEVVNINTTGEEKAESRVGNKSSQQISKNWSNLKKVIILKRFVKALEKVNKFNPRKPRYPTLEPDPLGQKIHLRHQKVEERKKADEWMLDSALRQVISTLAPAQKRKVALLVQAFETVTPPEINTDLRSNAKAPSRATPVQKCTYSVTQIDEQTNSGSLCTSVSPEMSFEKAMDQVSNFSATEGHIPGTCSVPKERSLGFDCSNTMMGPLTSEPTRKHLKEEDSVLTDDQPGFTDVSSTNPKEPRLSSGPDDSKSTFHEEFQVGGKIILEVTKELPSIYDSEFYDCDTKFNHHKLETGNLLSEAGEQSWLTKSLSPEDYGESIVISNVVSSTSLPELLEDPRVAGGEEANTKYEVLQKFSALEASEPCDTIDMAQESKLEKQKYTRLWYLIYKHMVSSSTKVGPQPPLEEAHKEEQRSNANPLLGMKDDDSSKDFVDMNHKFLMDNHKASSHKIDQHHTEAIKIIEEAIDEIPLPAIQDDSPHDPSITGNMLQEQEFQKKRGKVGELFISISNDSARDSFRESNNTKVEHATAVDPKETKLNSNNITAPAESETFSKSENKSKPQLQKSWSNLKKVILLTRFIKSLEKVRKFNPREPQYLPFELDTGAEAVHLRHQNTEDRKNAEEWMLDYTLQQVVAKLTPARKRKVELLVEAFETITPMFEVKSGDNTIL